VVGVPQADEYSEVGEVRAAAHDRRAGHGQAAVSGPLRLVEVPVGAAAHSVWRRMRKMIL
jgi:hypothetical protein